MQIAKNYSVISKINSLAEINELNMSLSEIFLSIIGTYDDDFISEIKKSGNFKENFLLSIADILDIDLSSKENLYIWKNYIEQNINEINPDIYLNNDYYKEIKISNTQVNGYQLIVDHYEPYEIFSLKDIYVVNNIEKTSLGYFSKKFPFICLSKNNVTWMSVTPNEIETMKDDIAKVTGSVLIYGLGIGYFAFMASNKKDVKEITIIENDQNIIDLFTKQILPQFKNKQKITIVKADAKKYQIPGNRYNYIYIDLWHNAEDGIELFLYFKNIEKNYKSSQFLFWLESSFYALLRRAFITLLSEQIDNKNKYDYSIENNIFDKLVNMYYFKTKNLIIDNPSNVDELIQNENLLKLLIG